MTTDAPTPELYRAGVGAMLVNGEGRVFVGHRIDTAVDAWQMPQGGIEKDEDPASAVFRELKEETGTDEAEIVAESAVWRFYDLPADIAARMWKGRYRGQRMRWFLLSFKGRDADIRIGEVEKPEFNAWKWVEPASLPDIIVPFKRALYEDLLREFGPVLRLLRDK